MAPTPANIINPSSLVQRSRTLGSGVFAVVRFGKLRIDRKDEFVDVAVKISRKSKTTLADVRNEIRIMGSLKHENILKLIGVLNPSGWGELPWLIMEYMEHGHLSDFMKEHSEYCNQTFKMNTTRSVISGMKYLNVDKGIVHGDLHAFNVLVGGNHGEIIKVSDFGLSFKIRNEHLTMSRPIGRFGRPNGDVVSKKGCKWKPPEWIPGVHYRPIVTRPGDVWAFGVLLFEIWNGGRLPFHGMKNEDIVCILIARGYNPLHFDSCDAPPRILNIMHWCFMLAPVRRPNFRQILDVIQDNSLAPICEPIASIKIRPKDMKMMERGSESASDSEETEIAGSSY